MNQLSKQMINQSIQTTRSHKQFGEMCQYKIFDKHNQPTKVIDTKKLDNHIKEVKKHKPASDHAWRRKYPNAKNHHVA